ncbi:hypothetical protein [Pseudarthrobacter sp. NIBRBAC000502770]|uniref:hypothetical protein n=1 Tax=Pseudarthrobacter sp. NIBRBAC000502770 TaxID=2590785 RepID=UPI00143D5618|nr:hypothetical protein [Pseudarthrobacter sp. NIBRBAC000502770]
MIRKERKACWIYTCPTCDVTATGPDQWTVYEFQWHHVRSLAHAFKVIGQAFQPVVDAYAAAARSIIGTTEQFQKDYALLPPPNLPHDPSMLRDRRKWGGK